MKSVNSASKPVLSREHLLLDASAAADGILSRDIEFCLRRMHLESRESLIRQLRKGDPAAGGCFKHGLARHVARYLGANDQDIKVVYLLDHGPGRRENARHIAPPARLLHLIIWAQPKTAALAALVAALDRTLALKLGPLLGKPMLDHAMDVQVIDDVDVTGRTGYAALLFSTRYRPVPVWKRQACAI